MTTAHTTAADRVAALRKYAAATGEPLDHLSDLEVLNAGFDMLQADHIATRDRYMGLLTSLRQHDEAVRDAVIRELTDRADLVVAQAVRHTSYELTRILDAVEALPERPGTDHVARVKQIAASARHMIRLLREQDEADGRPWKPDSNRDLVHNARNVLGVLAERDGIPADEVIRLVGEALSPNGNLRDLFTVADQGTTGTRRREPEFMGEGWHDRRSYYAYEPGGDVRVVAYSLGDAWHLDLYEGAGRLLAYGVVPESKVAALAPVLVSRAPAWSAENSGYPWRRFADTVTALGAA
ncbi:MULTISPECIES: hypothetical protein [Streptomyces]|uniref:Uncharacterized protein n=1 Tax=Streptomyces sp. F12 TaxID=1436084 RepID=V9Z6F9_9ACTN|nr:hypothetical protein [Streptomyces sp. F12]AHE40122.1 hypothetical protein pFRL6_35 [Streptomyces sp. F12]